MSIVEIVQHDEVIYTILDKPPPEPPKTPRDSKLSCLEQASLSKTNHNPGLGDGKTSALMKFGTFVSNQDWVDRILWPGLQKGPFSVIKHVVVKYHSQLEKQLKEMKIPKLRRTFGYAETPLKPPDNFLKKGEGIGQPVKKSDHKCFVSGNLPPVPKRPPFSKKTDTPKVNFRVVNIKKAIKTKPKPVEPRLVDTRDGHIKKIKGSGEVPEYCLRDDFGQMPAYLVKRNRRIQRELDKIKYAEEHKESLCKLINEQERQELLKDLKYNWQLMQKAFLQLPMLTDTIPKILKKTKMEQELRQLEKDIALVESNPYIYIYE